MRIWRLWRLRWVHVEAAARRIRHKAMRSEPPMRNVVICGCPRSGTTILNLCLINCTEGTAGWDDEVSGDNPIVAKLTATRFGTIVISKRPRDYAIMDKIRWMLPGVRFIYLWRDPAGNIASKYEDTDKTFVTDAGEYIYAYENMKKEEGKPDVLVVKYKDLINETKHIEEAIHRHTGLVFTVPLAEAWKEIPEGNWRIGKLRPFDRSTITRWRKDPVKRARVSNALMKHPKLAEILKEYGDTGGVENE